MADSTLSRVFYTQKSALADFIPTRYYISTILGKMPRTTKPTGKTRHDPLYVQLKEDELQEKYGSVSRPGKRKKTRDENDDEGGEVREMIILVELLAHYIYVP